MPGKQPELDEVKIESAMDKILSMQPEFIKPALQLTELGVRETVVFFGAAKIQAPEVAQRNMQTLEARFTQLKRKTKKHWDELDRAADAVYMSRFYEHAYQLAQKLSNWSKRRKSSGRKLVVATGGGPGIMEAANKGAYDAGALSAGFGIKIPTEQKLNDYITPELSFYFDHFITRKFWLMYPARALIVFPGGIGTLDELFEVYTLMKTRKAERIIPIVLYGREYWEELIHFPTMVRFATILESDLKFLHYSDTVDDAFDYITQSLDRND